MSLLFTEELIKKGIKVETVRLKGGEGTFVGESIRALLKKKVKLEREYDASDYDLIFIGSPVWAFSPTPAIYTFLEEIKGVENKRSFIFITYGSGAGKDRALRIMKEILRKKGSKDIYAFHIGERELKNLKRVREKVKFFLESSLPSLLS